MLTIGSVQFPERGNVDECRQWKPVIRFVPLASRVLAVARTRIEGKWCAYIDAVDGVRHSDEAVNVLNFGTKLPEEAARALFPMFEDVPYAD